MFDQLLDCGWGDLACELIKWRYPAHYAKLERREVAIGINRLGLADLGRRSRWIDAFEELVDERRATVHALHQVPDIFAELGDRKT